MRRSFITAASRWVLLATLATTVTGCGAINDHLDSRAFRRGWVDSNNNVIETPELGAILDKCNYFSTMYDVERLRYMYPRPKGLKESLDDYLTRYRDEEIEISLHAEERTLKADAMEIAVKQCVREKGVTAKAAIYNTRTGVVTLDTIQGAQ